MRNNIENLPQGCSMAIDIEPRYEVVTISAKKADVQKTVFSDSLPANMPTRTNIQYDQERIIVQLFAMQNTLIVEVTFSYATGQVLVRKYGYMFFQEEINLTK